MIARCYLDFVVFLYDLFFFFSSRRRHTRLQGDWSSDVCSSDLDSKSNPGARAVASSSAAQSGLSRQLSLLAISELSEPLSCRVGSERAVLKKPADRKSTRLNSSHLVISYAVFCLKKKTHYAWTN